MVEKHQLKGLDTLELNDLQLATTISHAKWLAEAQNAFKVYKTHGGSRKAEFFRFHHAKQEEF